MMDGPELITLEAARAAQEPWPTPDMTVLNEGRRRPPELPTDVFGPFWAKWVVATAEGCSAPRDYVATGVLGITGALIGNARWVSPWTGWSEPSALWIANIGSPSSGTATSHNSPNPSHQPQITQTFDVRHMFGKNVRQIVARCDA